MALGNLTEYHNWGGGDKETPDAASTTASTTPVRGGVAAWRANRDVDVDVKRLL